MKFFLRKIISKFSKYSKIYDNAFDLVNIIKFHKIDIIFDVGASWGGYALTLRRFGYKNKIISFEPVKQSHKKLIKNSINDKNWIVHNRVVVSDKNQKKIDINVSKDFDNSSILELNDIHKENHKDSKYTHKEEVLCESLNVLMSQYQINRQNLMLKIDVQGYEMNVLNSCYNKLSLFKLVQLELSLQPLYKDQILYDKILNFMKDIGFEIWSIYPGYKKKNIGQLYQFDVIFYKK